MELAPHETGGSSASPAEPPRIDLSKGDPIPELKVTPDKYLPHRYAGASGDFNPIHIDPEFAKQVGLPGNILHGLWMMAQVARAHTRAAGGDPRALKRLSVQFRGMGFPEQELVVSSTVKEASNGTLITDTVAAQGDNQVIRNAEAEIRLR
jgi:acyl dehydratase